MKRLISILCFFLPSLVFGQRPHPFIIDSLLNVLPSARDDKSRVDVLVDIAMEYRYVDIDSGLFFAQQALDLAKNANWKKGIGLANSALAVNYQYRSDYVKAYEYDTRALLLFEEIGDKREVAYTLRSIASTYQYEKNYPKVLEYTNRALKIFEQMGDKRGIASSFSNLGIFYFFQGNYDKALEYHFKALELWGQVEERERGSALGNIGDVYMHKGDYLRALEYEFRSLNILQGIGDKYGTAIDLGNIGETYYAIATDTSGAVFTSSLVPVSRQAVLSKAIEYLSNAIAASREIDQLENIIEFDRYLSKAYEARGDYRNALETYKVYATVQDSVYSLNNAAQIRQSEHAHELAIKDRDIRLANLAIVKKRNERNFLFAGMVVLLGVVGIVLRSNARQKQSNKLLTTEKGRSDELLLNILPAEVADELKEKGTSTARFFDNVTVMFTDFVDFTKAAERMTPRELVGELDACFKGFDKIIRKHNIEKIKTVGDAYLAVAGLPLANPAHAETIIRAAFEIRDFMNMRRAQMGDKTFEVRVGIHSGNVVAGIVGVIKFAYDIWGDTVNTAARMEEHGVSGKVNISQVTYQLVENKFQFEYRGEIQAKNKGKMAMYFAEPGSSS